MKLRIQDSSVRFRITLRELEQLAEEGTLACETCVPPGEAGEQPAVFRYEVHRDGAATESRLHVRPFAISLHLGASDFAALASDTNEGAYIRREWVDGGGAARRFVVFIEKDRPGSGCEKPEAWIYESNPGATPTTRPIPPREKALP